MGSPHSLEDVMQSHRQEVARIKAFRFLSNGLFVLLLGSLHLTGTLATERNVGPLRAFPGHLETKRAAVHSGRGVQTDYQS